MKRWMMLLIMLAALGVSSSSWAVETAFNPEPRFDKIGAVFQYLYNAAYARAGAANAPADVRKEYLDYWYPDGVIPPQEAGMLDEFYALNQKYGYILRKALLGKGEAWSQAWIQASELGVAKGDVFTLIKLLTYFDSKYFSSWPEQTAALQPELQALKLLNQDGELQRRVAGIFSFLGFKPHAGEVLPLSLIPAPPGSGIFGVYTAQRAALEVAPGSTAEEILPNLWQGIFYVADSWQFPHYGAGMRYLEAKGLQGKLNPLQGENFSAVYEAGLFQALSEGGFLGPQYECLSRKTPDGATALEQAKLEAAEIFTEALKAFFASYPDGFNAPDGGNGPAEFALSKPVDYFLAGFLSPGQQQRLLELAGVPRELADAALTVSVPGGAQAGGGAPEAGAAPRAAQVPAGLRFGPGNFTFSYSNDWQGVNPDAEHNLNWSARGELTLEERTSAAAAHHTSYVQRFVHCDLDLGSPAPNYLIFDYNQIHAVETPAPEGFKYNFWWGLGGEGTLPQRDDRGATVDGSCYARVFVGAKQKKPLALFPPRDEHKAAPANFSLNPVYEFGKSLSSPDADLSRLGIDSELSGKPVAGQGFKWGCRYRLSAPTANLRAIVGDLYGYIRYYFGKDLPAWELGYRTGYYPTQYDRFYQTTLMGITWEWK